MIRFIDYYSVLKVAVDANSAKISDAFQQRILELDTQHHVVQQAEETAKLIQAANEAHLVLSNQEARDVFDKLKKIYSDGALIPGAAAAPVIVGEKSTADSKEVAKLHSEFYETYFAHFIERAKNGEAITKVENKKPAKVKVPVEKSARLSRNNRLAGIVVALFIVALALKLLFAEPTTPQLLSRFEKATPFEKVRLVELIGNRRDVAEKGKEQLLAAFTDEREDVVVRGALAKTLAMIAGESTAVQQELIKAVSSPQPFLRIHAVQSLGLIKNPSSDVATTLYQSLNDDNEQVRLAASSSIANLGSQLIERDIATRSASGVEIEDESPILEDEISVATAIEDLKDPTPIVRISAIRALATEKKDREMIAKELIPLLNDSESAVVVATAQALGILQDESAIWALLSTMADQDEKVRLAAAAALSKMPQEKVKLALSELPTTTEDTPKAETIGKREPATLSAPELISEQTSTEGELLLGSLNLAEEPIPAIPPSIASPQMMIAKLSPQDFPITPLLREDIDSYPDKERLLNESTTINSSDKIELAKLTTLPAIAPPLAEPIPAIPPSIATPLLLTEAIGRQISPAPRALSVDKEQYPDIDSLLSRSIAVKEAEPLLEKGQLASLSVLTEPIPEPEIKKEPLPIPGELSTPDQLLAMSWSDSVKLARKQFGTQNRKSSVETFLAHQSYKIQTIGCLIIAERGFASATELEKIKSLIKNNNPHLLAAAAWALAELPGVETPELEKRLGQLIQDKSYWVRLHAARALGRFGTPTAQELLKQQSAN